MEIRLPLINNPKTGLKRDLLIQDLNVSFLSESAIVLCQLNTYDINNELYTVHALPWNIVLQEKFPESLNTLVDWRGYFGTPEFYNDLKLFAESQTA